MKLGKDSFWVKLAYRFSNKDIPKKTNLCKFFWRCVVMLFFHFLAVVLGMIMIPILAVVSFLFGYRIKFDRAHPIVPIKTIPRIAGKRVLPIVVAGSMLVLFFFNDLYSDLTSGGITSLTLLLVLCTIAMVSVLCLIRSLIAKLYGRLRGKLQENDGWRIFKAFIKAKKNKVCPTIYFVGGDENTEGDEDIKTEVA